MRTISLCSAQALGPTYCLRQRMLHFVQNFVYYMMFEVINPRWHELEKNMESVRTVDDVLGYHNDFQDATLKECLLTNQELLRLLTKLMTTCLMFCEEMNNFTEVNELVRKYEKVAGEERQERLNQDPDGYVVNVSKVVVKGSLDREKMKKRMEGRKLRMKNLSEALQEELGKGGYGRMIAKFEASFDTLLSQFMKALLADADAQYHSHLSNLCVRLDYNGFWTGVHM